MMVQWITPTIRIVLGLMALTIGLILVAFMLDFIPDARKSELDARARIAEALAIQLSLSASRNDAAGVQETIDSVVRRNDRILSVALRQAGGKVLISSGNHDRHWQKTASGKSTPQYVKVPLKDGDKAWGDIEISFKPLPTPELVPGISMPLAALIGFMSMFGLLGYYILMRRALRELDPSRVIPERVQAAFDTLAEGVLVLDNKDRILLSNAALANLVGQPATALVGKKPEALNLRARAEGAGVTGSPWREAAHNNAPVKGRKMIVQDGQGTPHSFVVNASCIHDNKGRVTGTIATFDDVTDLEHRNDALHKAVNKLRLSEQEISRRNRELEYMASHDALSGCLNRRAFFARLEKALEQASKWDQPLACIMVDLDHFKSVNDRFGHGVGDQVIKGVAGILKANCRDEDFAGRYGGEEFCGIFVGLNEAEARQMAERIRLQIHDESPAWFPVENRSTGSIGLAMREGSYSEAASADLVDRADKALYAAKEGGRNQVILYSQMQHDVSPAADKPAETNDAVAARLEARAENVQAAPIKRTDWFKQQLQDALRSNALTLVYQPIIDVQSTQLVSAEALVRFEAPALAQVSVADVIHAAEECGMIADIGERVLQMALFQLESWNAAGIVLPRISVNLSGLQLSDAAAVDRLVNIITDTGIQPDKLQLEITETARVQDFDAAAAAVTRLKALGVKIALDDYGTGQASLTYLRLFSPDVLKVDRSFVSKLETSPRDRILVSTSIEMAHQLGLRVVAEGVETAEQLACLRELKCDEAQGYGISYPLPADAAAKWFNLFAASNQPVAGAAQQPVAEVA